MKYHLWIFFLCLLLVSCKVKNMGTNHVPETITISQSQDADDYLLHLGDTLELQFTTNSSTGHRWRWLNKGTCTTMDSISIRYHQVRPELVGSSAKMHWKFASTGLGTDTLLFGYGPSYDAGVIVKERKVIVHVER